ncbi:hypothetical protein OE88DRAFT_1651152 [Heliocybe sulcata]|uniref:Uncharacterized protein n=1 Tax=Heliocybe sulcata TaxID=5364 RepID=A0A5C3NLS8_9AGAM|nr:hypothetical protein OE88DRAFT_1651152 [Heliocybe sulcata]
MKFRLRYRDDAPWEVVDQAEVEPIFMYDEEEGMPNTILSAYPRDKRAAADASFPLHLV